MGILILGGLFFLISSLISKKNHFISSNSGQLQTGNLTVGDLVQKDSDGDGVVDWEEALWGTDPNNKTTFNGESDADYIKGKREELRIANGGSSESYDNTNLSETDKFAQEFFASFSAMKQNGEIDSTTINNVSAALGQKMVDPTLIDGYTTKDLKISEKDGVDQQKAYYSTIKNLFDKYSIEGIGDEVEIASSLANATITPENKLKYTGQLNQIADAYQEYSQKITNTQVPQSLASYSLAIANSANNTGIAVRNMVKVVDDPIIGLSGLSQYQKYSEDLISSVGNLETILYNNGVITQ